MKRKIPRQIWAGIVSGLKVWIIALIVLTFIATVKIGETITLQNALLEVLTRHIEQSETINNDRMMDVYGYITTILKNDIELNGKLVDLLGYTNEIAKRTVEIRKDIRIPNLEKLIKANVVLVSKEYGHKGSGTIIKYRGKLYILSVAHLDGDSTICLNGDFGWKDMKTIHIDPKKDLALFEFPENIEEVDYDYIEVSKGSQKIGDKIWVVGNPEGFDDMVTSGILSKHDKGEWFITAPIYFGNSGGAVVNKKGELVGITHAMIISFFEEEGMVTVGIAIDLETIKEFLEEADVSLTKKHHRGK